MKLSTRLPGELRPNALSVLLEEKRRRGERILDLSTSNPTQAGIEYPAGFLDALAGEGALLYEPAPFGMPAARECISREYGAPYDNVILTASTSEAYSWIFKLLCDPGCEVLVPRPSYPLFEYLARLESVEVRHYSLFYDHGWYIDFHTIERALSSRTRAIVLVNPNNPTGHFTKRREAEGLRDLCERHGIALISDEVFADYQIDPDPESLLSLQGLADFTLNGLSKAVGLPQMKLAWMITKQPVPELEIIADTYLSVGAPVQVALPSLLALKEPIQRQIVARVRGNLARVARYLRVEAGWYAIVPVLDEEETALRLLRDFGILVQPGYFYDFEKSGYLVVSLLTPPEIFQPAIEILSKPSSTDGGTNFAAI
ncbi:MAG TPA: pyridoxal phosphate-dependent aminotransferase [Bryobacteraceae bacterium]|nr:pyridoxal phosphate-dependent aminotransferase [Bryobacteraceae bacterium]